MMRSGRLSRYALAAALAALLSSAVLPGEVSLAAAANAAPKPAATTKPPLADDISAAKAELATLNDNLDIADESYRDGQLKLAQAKLNQAASDKQLAAGRARTAALQNQVDQVAVLAYQTGGSPDVLMATSDGTADLAESTALLGQFAADQDSTLSSAGRSTVRPGGGADCSAAGGGDDRDHGGATGIG